MNFKRKEQKINDLYNMYKENKLLMDIPIQRKFVWPRSRTSYLIESILLDIPIPEIFLFINDKNEAENCDGKQRTTSIIEFIDNKFQLCSLEKLKKINSKRFFELAKEDREKIKNYRLAANFGRIKNNPVKQSRVIQEYERLCGVRQIMKSIKKKGGGMEIYNGRYYDREY